MKQRQKQKQHFKPPQKIGEKSNRGTAMGAPLRGLYVKKHWSVLSWSAVLIQIEQPTKERNTIVPDRRRRIVLRSSCSRK